MSYNALAVVSASPRQQVILLLPLGSLWGMNWSVCLGKCWLSIVCESGHLWSLWLVCYYQVLIFNLTCVCFGEMHFQCSEDKYVTSAYQWMVPFLHRCEKQSPGVANELLKEYLVTLAKGDLKLPLKIFQHSKPDVSRNVFKISVHFPLKNYVLFTKFVILGLARNFSSNQKKWLSFYSLKMFHKLSPKIFWKFIKWCLSWLTYSTCIDFLLYCGKGITKKS